MQLKKIVNLSIGFGLVVLCGAMGAMAGPASKPGAKPHPLTAVAMPADLQSAFENARYGIKNGRAQNDANGFSVQFSGAETRLELKGGAQAAFTVKGYGWGSTLEPAGPVTQVQASGTRLDRHYAAGLAEWFLNTPQGLEQGFVLAQRARKAAGPLHIQLAASDGWSLRSAGNRVRLTQGAVTLDYAGLKAYDASGATLPSRLRASGSHIDLEVDDARAVYPLTIDPTLTQQAELTASDAATFASFGQSVALSGDGNTALVGAVGGNGHTGSAYVFTRSGGTWTQQAELTASGGAVPDLFGYSVALSSDGSTALVGAVNVGTETGAAYIFIRGGTIWTQQQELTGSDAASGDEFGESVALSGDGKTALIGAPHAQNGLMPGAAYTFTLSNGTWSQQSKLSASGAYNLGISVAMSGDGNTALVGSGQGVSIGAAYVFTRSGTAWTQQSTLTASDGAATDAFGRFVALSSNGTTALVGAYIKNSSTGAAYIFTASGVTWSQQQELIASDATAGDNFGCSVALSSDGSTALVGAYGKNSGAGAAYTFTFPGVTWSQQQELTASDATAGDNFGWSVALSGDGSTALVGALGSNSYQGRAYPFGAVTPCSAGSYSATGDTPCTPAPAGSYVASAGATSYSYCLAGTYQPGTGQTSCLPAPAGSYVSSSGATSASFCAAGTFTSTTGNASCTSAPAGSYATGPGATSSTLCLAGTFSSAAGQASCTSAPAGSYVSSTGATAATLCLAGTFSSTAGRASCTSAPAGSYATGPGATSSTLCPAGTFSSTAGQASCTSVPAGSYATGPGATSSTLCLAGTFSSTAGQASCTSAPAGSYVSSTGATAATLCPAGTFSSTAGQVSCTSAPAGSYVASTGATAATACAAGTYQPNAGQASCISAGLGYFVASPGQTNETACPTGQTTFTPGATSCVPIYNFSGFLSPISNPPAINMGKAGKTYPVKWQLLDYKGAFVTTLAAVKSVTYQSTSCAAFATAPSGTITTTVTGGTGLRYDTTANQYVYNWATPGPGCYTLILTLSNGQAHAAYFNLK